MLKYTTILLIFIPWITFAQTNYVQDINDIINTDMKRWASRSVVINSVLAQNSKSADLSISDFKILDTRWKSEKRKNKRPLISKLLNNRLSEYLKEVHEEGQGIYTEIIIIDDKGLNVGQSRVSENLWQGQQEKWLKTFGSNSYTPNIGKLHFDDNTELFQVEVSFMMIHEDEPIGIVYAGIDIEQIEAWKKRKEEGL